MAVQNCVKDDNIQQYINLKQQQEIISLNKLTCNKAKVKNAC
jgi:hypothetical protein